MNQIVQSLTPTLLWAASQEGHAQPCPYGADIQWGEIDSWEAMNQEVYTVPERSKLWAKGWGPGRPAQKPWHRETPPGNSRGGEKVLDVLGWGVPLGLAGGSHVVRGGMSDGLCVAVRVSRWAGGRVTLSGMETPQAGVGLTLRVARGSPQSWLMPEPERVRCPARDPAHGDPAQSLTTHVIVWGTWAPGAWAAPGMSKLSPFCWPGAHGRKQSVRSCCQDC